MTREISAQVRMTPELCAEWFVNAYSDEQAQFFALVEQRLATEISNHLRDMQMIAVAKVADTDARNFIFRLANWLKAKGLGGKQWDSAIDHYSEARP